MLGTVVGLALVIATSAALAPWRADISRTVPALVFVLYVVAVAVVGGRAGAVVTGVFAAAAFNVVFIPPYWTFEVSVLEDVVALVAFTAVALAVGSVVAREARQRQAAEDRAEQLTALHERYEAVQNERQRLAAEATRLTILEQVDEQRAALLRSVSHDLRTPLSTIRAVTSDLRAGTDYDPATRDELLDLVVDEAERLDRIVANLLSMSRIEAGAFEPHRQAVAVDELVGDCLRRLGRVLRQHHVEVCVPDGLPLIAVDYSQLDQVVTNLLENAARHTPPGAKLRIDAEERDGLVVMAVEDDGGGVAAEDRARIFEPFGGGTGTSTTSGVGLSICRAIVEAHGGTIGVEDGIRGARFVFTVPAWPHG